MPSVNLQGLILPVLVYLLARPKTVPIPDSTVEDEYDYIIVGSGAGGSILANRLSQDPAIKVLLLEAGGKDNVTTEVPSLPLMLHGSDYDWKFHSTPQKHTCLSCENMRMPITAGKVIGGSTSIGFLAHSRGNKLDYDEWENLGNPGWSYDKILPYFKKSENYMVKSPCVESKYHGCGGEITFTAQEEMPTVSQAFIKGLEELGLSETDIDGENQIGHTGLNGGHAISDGIRMGSARGFLKDILNRTNLHISMKTLVTKIIIDPDTKKATGVEFEKGGETKIVKAKKEVILSAGAINSPKILMLSGIGPKEDLEKLNIPVLIDLPGVGKNFQDHVNTPFLIKADRALSKEELALLSSSAISQWGKGKGPMTSPSGLDVSAFMQSKMAPSNDSRPDFEFTFQSLPILSVITKFYQAITGLTDEAWDRLLEPLVDKPVALIHTFILNPKSRGFIKLSSGDPHDPPEIETNTLSDEQDRQAMIEGLKIAERIFNSTMFNELGYKLVSLYPTDAKFEPPADDYYKTYFTHFTVAAWNYCGTNKMGPDTDPTAVVDHRLRVKGVSGLRVVDASIIPVIPRGHINEIATMIGEKAAEMIKEDNA